MLPTPPNKVISSPDYRGSIDSSSSPNPPAGAEPYLNWSCREAARAFRHYGNRFEKLRKKLEHKLAAGTFRQLPAGTRRKLIRRYRRLKAKLEKLRLRLLKLGGLAALSLVLVSNPAQAAASNPLELSSLNGSNGFVINGINSDDLSGYSVSNAGDVNGDGFDDLIIGAYKADTYTGESYVVFGQGSGFSASLDLSSLNGNNGFTIAGIDTGDNSGRSVSGAGDVNGDGFDDLIIGAHKADSNRGESYVVFGKASGFAANLDLSSLDGNNGFEIKGIDSYDYSGWSVSRAGDVNGDGFGDIVIGAYHASPNGKMYAGESYVIFGKAEGFGPSLNLSSLDGSNGFAIKGIDAYDYSGRSVSGAGDVNEDGFDDIIIGADGARPDNYPDAGESYIVFGRSGGFDASLELSNLNGIYGFVLNGNSPNDLSGKAVGHAGDVNGDGIDDYIISGENGDPGSRSNAGETYVLFGFKSIFRDSFDLFRLNGFNGFILNGIDADDRSGFSVNGAGDVNGDGFDDVIIGAPYAAPGAIAGAGESYLVFGGIDFEERVELSTLDGNNGFILNGIDGNDNSGFAVNRAGDMNGDGFDDFIIGAKGANPGSQDFAGESYVIFGGNFTGGAETQTGDTNDNIINGTEGIDILVGGQGNDTISGDGGADVLRGGQGDDILAVSDTGFQQITGGRGTDTLRLEGSGLVLDLIALADNRIIGIEAIDIHGTGANSLILDRQSVLSLSDESNTLKVLASADDTIGIGFGWKFDGMQSVDSILFNVYTQRAAILMIEAGAQINSGARLDLSRLDGNDGFVINGIHDGDRSGLAVSNAGDVNGDGFDDFIIGAALADPNFDSSAGESYVVFGHGDSFKPNLDLANLDGSNGFVINGINDYDYSGRTVSGAGDVNGDGFADVIIGAPSASGSNDAGESYVVFGKSGGFTASLELSGLDGTNGTLFSGIDRDDQSGTSVRGAGDINGDGLDDLVIGAILADPNDTNRAGESYVVYGNANGFGAHVNLSSLDGNNGFVINGIDAYNYAGRSVSNAGDVNGDGFSDLIIGADKAAPNGVNRAGESYVVYGKANGFGASFNLSSLNGNNGFAINGINVEDYSGRMVSSAGDVNGDGYDDLLISAPSADPEGRNRAGESYVIFGSTNVYGASLELSDLDGSNGFTIRGINAEDDSGASIRSAGDVNGDGFDDIIIGAPRADPEGVNSAGISYLIYGKASGLASNLDLSTLDGRNGFIIKGINFEDFSGESVSGAGDVNGDGFDDIIIGANAADPGDEDEAGKSYLIFGGNFTGGTETQVGDAGDNELNGSGNNDVLIGGQGNDTLVGLGGADVLRGGEGDDVLAISDAGFQRLVGGNGMDTLRLDGSGLTLNLTTIADNRTDGIERIDIRGAGANELVLDQRTVLNLSGETNALEVLAGAEGTTDIGSGWVLDTLVLVDGVMYSSYTQGTAMLTVEGPVRMKDLALSGSGHTLDLTTFAGNHIAGIEVVDIRGTGRNIFIVDQQTVLNLSNESNTLMVLATADDTVEIGDGWFFVGLDSIGGRVFSTYTQGAARLMVAGQVQLEGLATGDGSVGFTINGIDEGDRSGYSLSSAGDVDGDGFDDVIIGARRADPNDISQAGESYVIFGKATSFGTKLELSDLDGNNGFVINGIDMNDLSGGSVSSAGDVNGDGFDDVITGAHGASPGGEDDAGVTYIIYGKPSGFGASLELSSLDGSNGSYINGIDAGDYSGGPISKAGDVNGDGFDDIIIAATRGDPGGNNNTGETYVVFGKANGFGASLELSNLDGSNGFVISGININDRSGNAVSNAGDMNGDGFNDIIIGVLNTDPNGIDRAGASYIVFGKEDGFDPILGLSNLNGNNGFVINGINELDYSGYSVSSAGDVNGDGYDDVIIGASRADPGGRLSAGSSYVVFGKASGFSPVLELSSLDGNNGFVINGVMPDDYAGVSVSNAGDVNGDGFSDLIIAAPYADPSGLNHAGSNYVVFGKADGFDPNLELSSLDGSNGFVINGIASDDSAGHSVSSAGDMNGDGFGDLIIGARFANPNNKNEAGESYVIYGGNFTGARETVSVLTIGLNAEGAYEMQFVGLTGVEYVVEYSTDLETWLTLTTVMGSANSKLIVDAEAAGQPERFYRVRALNEEPDQ